MRVNNGAEIRKNKGSTSKIGEGIALPTRYREDNHIAIL